MIVPAPAPTVGLSNPPTMSPIASKNVAVIGAGAAGLITAYELGQEGHKVVVFERENQVGGTWVYNPAIESDPLGLDPTRDVIHSSLYASLRTNLPREVMGFRAYPFLYKKGNHRDPRRFPGHREVLEYLKDFAIDFKLCGLVRFGTEVWHVALMENGKWKVTWRRREGNGYNDRSRDRLDEVYDAVVVCNGHYTEPRPAEIPGVEGWPGKQLHSHNYRDPEPFRDQVCALSSRNDVYRAFLTSVSYSQFTYAKIHCQELFELPIGSLVDN